MSKPYSAEELKWFEDNYSIVTRSVEDKSKVVSVEEMISRFLATITAQAKVIELIPEPELPLSVRVAKALGPDWLELPHDKYPNYDTDLTLAMGALEEYCEKHENLSYQIIRVGQNVPYHVEIAVFDEGWSEDNIWNNDLPTAICEAIVKHKEEK